MLSNEYVEKIIKAKESFSIFKNIDENNIRSIISNVMFIRFKPNEMIIEEGQNTKEIYLLMEGECEVLHSDMVVAVLHEKEPFGEFAPITNEKRKATVRAKTDVSVISFKLNMNLLENSLKGYSVLYKNFVDELVKKVEMSNQRLL